MKIGLPKALLYTRYKIMWRVFFEELGCRVVLSGDTNQRILADGTAWSEGECCLPVKVFLGHVRSLIGRCDRILVPRFQNFAKDEEFCVRFWGLPDIVENTFPQARILTYNLRGQNPASELMGFLSIGRELGKSRLEAMRAYRHAKLAQQAGDDRERNRQQRLLAGPGLKVLVAAQPYLIHDPYVGGPLLEMIRRRQAVPVFPDRCRRAACRRLSRQLSTDLYWTANKEVIGAIPLLRGQVDGVILLTAFPCGTDSLVNELTLRRVRGIPMTHIILDEQQGEAGLETRVECFLDILRERRRSHAS